MWDGDLFNQWAISPEHNGTIKKKKRLGIINNKIKSKKKKTRKTKFNIRRKKK